MASGVALGDGSTVAVGAGVTVAVTVGTGVGVGAGGTMGGHDVNVNRRSAGSAIFMLPFGGMVPILGLEPRSYRPQRYVLAI